MTPRWSPLTRFLRVILMIVKEASYLSLQRRGLLQIPDCTGAVEELALELRGNGIPAQKHGCAQTLQNLLFFLGEGSTVLAILFSVESSYRDELPSIPRFRQASCKVCSRSRNSLVSFCERGVWVRNALNSAALARY